MEDLFECMVKSVLKMLLDVISAFFYFKGNYELGYIHG